MSLVICPGIHSPQLTEDFIAGLGTSLSHCLVVPTDSYPAYSALHILKFLADVLGEAPHPPLLFIAFSAGVVGGIGAAQRWQRSGSQVKAFIAVDGWGVPLLGDFPIHRLSHDSFTHWSSIDWGKSQDSFYAEPGVKHLQLWQSPQTVAGWRVSAPSPSPNPTEAEMQILSRSAPVATTAAQFLGSLLTHYEESKEPVV
jgi:hypothetical protein